MLELLERCIEGGKHPPTREHPAFLISSLAVLTSQAPRVLLAQLFAQFHPRLEHDVVLHAGAVPEVLVEALPHVSALVEHGIAHLVKVVPRPLEEGVVKEEVSHGDGNLSLSCHFCFSSIRLLTLLLECPYVAPLALPM